MAKCYMHSHVQGRRFQLIACMVLQVHVRVRACVCVYVRLYMCVYAHACVYVCMCVFVCVCCNIEGCRLVGPLPCRRVRMSRLHNKDML